MHSIFGKYVRAMLVAAAAIAFAGCSSNDTDYDSLFVGAANELAKGEEYQLTALAVNKDNTGRNVTLLADWSSDNAQVATVGNTESDKGYVRTLAEGIAKVTAKFDGKEMTIDVVVGPHAPVKVTVTPTYQIVQPTTTATGGATAPTTLAYTASVVYTDGVRPIDADTAFTWSSSDETVATLAADATDTSKATATVALAAGEAGTAKLTATLKKGTATLASGTANLSVDVNPTSAYTVEVSPATTASVEAGKTTDIAGKVLVNGAAVAYPPVYTISYSSSDTKTATVSSGGTITGVKAGSATVSVSLKYGTLVIAKTDVAVTVTAAPATTP